MKPVSLHPGSVIAGVALAVVGLLVTGAKTPMLQGVLRPPPQVIEHHIVGIPDPREILEIVEGTPYVVPSGRRFVVTAVGATILDPGSFTRSTLNVDGIQRFQVSLVGVGWSSATSPTSLQQVPPHLVVEGNSTIDVDTGGVLSGRALGYLIDE